MNKRHINTGGIICLILGICIISLLLRDNLLPFSIPVVLSKISHFLRHWHVLAVGLLPIYVALMIFGTGILALYFGSALQRWITEFLHHK
jgi:hypothetical protein